MVTTEHFGYGQKEVDYLTRADAKLGAAMARIGKVEREVMPDLFAALVYAIVSQLISAKAARTIRQRMQDKLGAITPRNLAGQQAEAIQSCGVTMKKAECIRAIACAIEQGEFAIETLRELPDADVIRVLTGLKGIGAWTAEMMLIHALGRTDVVSWGDIAIRRGMIRLYGLDILDREQFEKYRLVYSPYGSVASIYLWEIAAE
ncbi:DNA-3-methyladenine glycosylase family protein [Paenibacillus hodogayensis]|uniref:DNA-3-methyladenine glycosylase II n=1 Tax=Paenibacillus hodogayensis TaxID=279208 RepID=A0ABV5W464_9BACL